MLGNDVNDVLTQTNLNIPCLPARSLKSVWRFFATTILVIFLFSLIINRGYYSRNTLSINYLNSCAKSMEETDGSLQYSVLITTFPCLLLFCYCIY